MSESKPEGTRAVTLASTAPPPELARVLEQMLSPLMEAMARMMKNNTEALDRLAATQKVQSDRIEAMERQIRLNTLVTPQQVRYFNEAIRKRAREILLKRECADDAKAVKSLSAMIRRAVLTRYGVSALHEIPKHEYPVVLSQVQTWNDALCVRDAVKEVRGRAELSGDDVPSAE